MLTVTFVIFSFSLDRHMLELLIPKWLTWQSGRNVLWNQEGRRAMMLMSVRYSVESQLQPELTEIIPVYPAACFLTHNLSRLLLKHMRHWFFHSLYISSLTIYDFYICIYIYVLLLLFWDFFYIIFDLKYIIPPCQILKPWLACQSLFKVKPYWS